MAATTKEATSCISKVPQGPGEDWVQELLNGHPGQFHDNLGISDVSGWV